ncbi:hypothetical protein PV755_42160 [Streptomyces caniscabiei]|uniref:hypothetical protein n=1 Tax=Streptomyces caniscabiei TaxID=2746961 RepID=UPI0023D9FD4D|nr:hypothetical protein [Streptomyces caniscabiei]MDX3515439.1 hypothetical protein [Streptomyces caniscabiei]MDX3724657.1 hypothetical protein [Streptomyces caniscabiei]MDX3733071.1 hypothetical protein [Streptomyces caniscabiei]WEO23984.1 hypothetical protein IHE65_12800 [Streptomyces caniscabiei]
MPVSAVSVNVVVPSAVVPSSRSGMFSVAVLVAAPALLPLASVSSENVVPAAATAASPAPAAPPRNLRRCSPLPLPAPPLPLPR